MANLGDDLDNSNFETLSAELSNNERKALLNKMKGDKPLDVVEFRKEDVFNDKIVIEDVDAILTRKLKNEPLFLKVYIRFKAAFSSMSVQDVYNQVLLKQIAREIDLVSNNLVSYRKKALLTYFYEKLVELKEVQSYINEYIDIFLDNEGEFYMVLGELYMNDVHEQIRKECDPTKTDLNKELNSDSRTNFINKINSIIDMIPSGFKSQLHNSARCLDWMKAFCRQPLDSMIGHFSFDSSNRACSFTSIKSEFNSFARVMNCNLDFTEDLLTALYNFTQKKIKGDDYNELNVLGLYEFMDVCSSDLALVNSFKMTTALKKLAKIIFDNSMYEIDAMPDHDGWLVKYKNQWKLWFDEKWEERNKMYKLEVLRKKLGPYFSLSQYPQFPIILWEHFSNIINYPYYKALGFTYYYLKTEFPKQAKILVKLAEEGIFSIKNNKIDFIDLVRKFNELSLKMDDFYKLVAADGELGGVLMNYQKAEIFSESDTERIHGVIEVIIRISGDILKSFLQYCTIMENILSAAAGERITTHYGPLLNLNKIDGKQNSKFIIQLDECTYSFRYALEVISELQALEGIENRKSK